MSFSNKLPSESTLGSLQYEKLTEEQVEQINRLLSSLGEYGEIHLIVQRGVLKYINKVESHKAWKDKEQG
jgi:hypothetical protein